MAAKKSTKRTMTKQGGGKRTARRKVARTKRPAERKLARSNKTRRKAAHKVAPVNAVGKRTIGSTTIATWKKAVRRKSQNVETVPFSRAGAGSRSGGQSGDLQGLSNVESSDSESVDELLQEGNSFEADVVMGVEDAGDAEGREVRTHEVLEDDVPGEYRDKE
jgi:hypothetical protein